MADSVKFELVSPEKILLSEDVEMVVIPGSEGNFGVLPGHSPLIASVRPGMIEVYENNVAVEKIFTTGGFAEVTGDRCTMLADEAVHLAELDRGAAEAELAEADSALPALRQAAESGDVGELAKLKAAEKHRLIAAAKIEALDYYAAH